MKKTNYKILFILASIVLMLVFLGNEDVKKADAANTPDEGPGTQSPWIFDCSLVNGDYCAPLGGAALGNYTSTGEGFKANDATARFYSYSINAGRDYVPVDSGNISVEVKGFANYYGGKPLILSASTDSQNYNPFYGFGFLWTKRGGDKAWFKNFSPAAKILENLMESSNPVNNDSWYRLGVKWNRDGVPRDYYEAYIEQLGADGSVVARRTVSNAGGSACDEFTMQNLIPRRTMVINVGPPGPPGTTSNGGWGGDGIYYRNLHVELYDGSREVTHTCQNEDVPQGADYGDPYDDPSNPYDGCSCISLKGNPATDPSWTPPCEDPDKGDDEIDLDDFPFDFKFSVGNGALLTPHWTLKKVMDEFFNYGQSQNPEPALDLTFSPQAPLQNTEVEAIVSPLNFRTRINNLYIGWCVGGIDENGTYVTPRYYNSVVAGGLPPEPYEGSAYFNYVGPCCDALTRTPAKYKDTDADNDGMGDEWEKKYFGSIEAADPDADPDRDGYYADRFMKEGKTGVENAVTAHPLLISYNDKRILTPGGSDASLTNLEEYILGTDPTSADTDGDGYNDEEDFVGVGQMSAAFKVFASPNQQTPYEVYATVIGINQNEGLAIVNNSRKLYMGEGGKMEVNLTASPNFLSSDSSEPLVVDSNVTGTTTSTSNLNYEWWVEDEGSSICGSHPDLCGRGNGKLVIGGADGIPPLEIGLDLDKTSYNVGVKVKDEILNKAAEAQTVILYGQGSGLTICNTERTQEIPASEDTVDICIAETPNNSALNFQWKVDGAADKLNSGLGKETYELRVEKSGGENYGIGVEIIDPGTSEQVSAASAIFPVIGPGITIKGPDNVQAGSSTTYAAELKNFSNTENLRYDWSLNGTRRESGTGMATFQLEVPRNIRPGSKYSLSVQATYAQQSQSVEAAIGSKEITIVGSSASTGGIKKMFLGLAKAADFIPEGMKQAVKAVFSLIGIICVFLIFMKVTKLAAIR